MTDVSIVIPFFNGGATVRRAIRSALNQDGLNVEVVVVDDGSPEKPDLEGLDHRRVTLMTYAENRGLAGALNAGVDAALGKYVICLGQDDWFEPMTLYVLWSALESRKQEKLFAFGATKYWGLRNDVYLPDELPDFTRHNASNYAVMFLRKAWLDGCKYHAFAAGMALEDWDMALQLIEAGYAPIRLAMVVLHYTLTDRGLHAASLEKAAALMSELRARHPQVKAEARL